MAVCRHGAQCLGMVGNGIYPTSSPKQLQHILLDSGTRVLFVENQEQLDKVLEVSDDCPELQHIVVMEREGLREFMHSKVSFFDDFLKQGEALGATQAPCLKKALQKHAAIR
jgi:long-chain acyl-CoA synthetase